MVILSFDKCKCNYMFSNYGSNAEQGKYILQVLTLGVVIKTDFIAGGFKP